MEEKVISFYDSGNGRPMPSFFEKMRYAHLVLTDIRTRIGKTDDY